MTKEDLEKKVLDLERRVKALENRKEPLRIVGTDFKGNPLVKMPRTF